MNTFTFRLFVTSAMLVVVIGCGDPAHLRVKEYPDEISINDLRKSLIGSSKAEVTEKLGITKYTFDSENSSYSLYKKRGTQTDLIMLPLIFIPAIPVGTDNQYKIVCMLLEFDRHDVLKRLDGSSCNHEVEFDKIRLRNEAKNGMIDSAIVLAVNFDEFLPLKKLANYSDEAMYALTMASKSVSYDRDSMLSLSIEELQRRGQGGDSEASYILYLYKAAPDPRLWLCRAADAGQHDARHLLGYMYWYGVNGVNNDPESAYMWYVLAMKTGSYISWKEVHRIRNNIFSANEVANAELLVRSWQPGQCERALVHNISSE